MRQYHELMERILREGVIPAELRFQIGLPFPASALNAFKADYARDFPKAAREPKRVQPSRDADRPSQRGRAGDPQPGGPPPGLSLQNQRGFGSKPRTGQGHEDEFDE